MDDETFGKRHSRPEADEKRRKRLCIFLPQPARGSLQPGDHYKECGREIITKGEAGS